MATQPCPCGYLTDPARACECQAYAVQRYLSKISGPLLDRIDLHIDVPALRYRELSGMEAGESYALIRERVRRARAIQEKRFRRRGLFSNADMESKDLREFCRLDDGSQELLRMALVKLGLSARAYDRIQKVARTIADLAGSDVIRPEHVSEAIQYRTLDRNLMHS